MTALHPTGVHHLAISTTDMKGQLEFWCDVLGCPLKALYWMHGVDNTFHGFVELAGDSYVAFVQHPDNSKEFEPGVTHAGNSGAPAPGGSMQHVAFNVDSLDDLYAMRDRIRSRGVRVIGPIDHGMCQSMYFAGPEGLTLEVATGRDIPAEQWIDREVQGLCGITAEELAALKEPAAYAPAEELLPNPPHDPEKPEMWYADPGAAEGVYSTDDKDIWERASVPDPPVPPQ